MRSRSRELCRCRGAADLTADALIGLGVSSIGHRRRLLAAIAALRSLEPNPPNESPKPPTVDPRQQPGAAERCQLTVMFSDLVDSTMLASRLDPEELGEVIGAYHRCVAEVVGRFDRFLAKYLGDGVLAYFGFPVAHEDDAERAVRAGLEITRAVAALDGGGAPLSARVGVATGLVVVGEISGGEANAAVGETPNLAARLQAEAPPGGVVIAPATRRLAGDWFSYRDLGARPLKGIAEPMRLTQVLDEQSAESRSRVRRAFSESVAGGGAPRGVPIGVTRGCDAVRSRHRRAAGHGTRSGARQARTRLASRARLGVCGRVRPPRHGEPEGPGCAP